MSIGETDDIGSEAISPASTSKKPSTPRADAARPRSLSPDLLLRRPENQKMVGPVEGADPIHESWRSSGSAKKCRLRRKNGPKTPVQPLAGGVQFFFFFFFFPVAVPFQNKQHAEGLNTESVGAGTWSRRTFLGVFACDDRQNETSSHFSTRNNGTPLEHLGRTVEVGQVEARRMIKVRGAAEGSRAFRPSVRFPPSIGPSSHCNRSLRAGRKRLILG